MTHPADPAPLSLPRGPHDLPRDVVRGSQRRRLVAATAELVALHGYAATRVGDIASLAGVSRSTFYEQFTDKEDLFLACYQAGSDTHQTTVEAALRSERDAGRQAHAGIVAYLGMLESDATFAQAFFIEAQVATPRIRARFLANLGGYGELLHAWHSEARKAHQRLPNVPPTVWKAAAGGIAGLCTQHLLDAGVSGLCDALTPPSVQLVLAVAGLA